MDAKQELGRRGEALVLRRLRLRGYRLVARNFTCRGGELDLVVRRGGTLVVVEVRSVSQGYLDSPLDSVGPRKIARVRRAARRFLQLHRPRYARLRFDLMGVRFREGRRPEVEWRKDAFAC